MTPPDVFSLVPREHHASLGDLLERTYALGYADGVADTQTQGRLDSAARQRRRARRKPQRGVTERYVLALTGTD